SRRLDHIEVRLAQMLCRQGAFGNLVLHHEDNAGGRTARIPSHRGCLGHDDPLEWRGGTLTSCRHAIKADQGMLKEAELGPICDLCSATHASARDADQISLR